MSDHDKTYERFCGPRFGELVKSVNHLSHEVHDRIDVLDEKHVRPMEAKFHNGFDVRIKNVEKMQWWQLGLMVTIVGMIITLHIL